MLTAYQITLVHARNARTRECIYFADTRLSATRYASAMIDADPDEWLGADVYVSDGATRDAYRAIADGLVVRLDGAR